MNAQAKQNLELYNLDARIRAFDYVIRRAEGTWGKGANGYNVFFGGTTFSSYTRHPNQVHRVGSLASTAAGAHQWLYRTWRDVAAKLDLRDFSPEAQTAAFIEKLRERGALQFLLNNDFESAIRKANKEWASLPESPYGQRTQSWATVMGWYNDALGNVSSSQSVDDVKKNQSSNSSFGVIVLVLLFFGMILRK